MGQKRKLAVVNWDLPMLHRVPWCRPPAATTIWHAV
jgi:hypothetical protein